MKIQSAKAKGRKLQQWVRDKINGMFQHLTDRDVKSTSMGASGNDVQLSEAAFKVFPYSIECKNQAKMKPVYDAYYQAKKGGPGEPLVIIKTNHEDALAIIKADHFFHLYSNREEILQRLHDIQDGK